MDKAVKNQVALCRECNKHKEAMALLETAWSW